MYRVAQEFVAKFLVSILSASSEWLILVPVNAEVTWKEEVMLQETVLHGVETLLDRMARFVSVH